MSTAPPPFYSNPSYYSGLASRLYFEISNSREKVCLTIDRRNLNSSGPAKYRTNAKSDIKKFCHFNHKKKTKFVMLFFK